MTDGEGQTIAFTGTYVYVVCVKRAAAAEVSVYSSRVKDEYIIIIMSNCFIVYLGKAV